MAFPQRHPTAASAARKRMASASQRATLLRSSADREADDLQIFLKSPHRTGRRLRSSRLRLERRIDGTPSKKHLRPRTGDRTHAIASMVRARGRGRRGFGEIEMRVVRGHRSGGRRDGAVTYLVVWRDVGICGRGRLDGLLAACSGSRSPKRCRESRDTTALSVCGMQCLHPGRPWRGPPTEFVLEGVRVVVEVCRRGETTATVACTKERGPRVRADSHHSEVFPKGERCDLEHRVDGGYK